MLGAETIQKYYSALIYLTIEGGVIRKNIEKSFISQTCCGAGTSDSHPEGRR